MHAIGEINLKRAILFIVSKGDYSFLQRKKCNFLKEFFKIKNFWPKFWIVIVLLLFIGATTLTIFGLFNEQQCVANKSKDAVTFIGILSGASFMALSILFSGVVFKQEIFYNKTDNITCESNTSIEAFIKAKKDIFSQGTIYICLQLILVFSCFLNYLFPFDSIINVEKPIIGICLQVITILFMIITDIHLIIHITTLLVSEPIKNKTTV